MAFIKGLPPLPKSLSGLLNFVPKQYKLSPVDNDECPPQLSARLESILASVPESVGSYRQSTADINSGSNDFEPYYVNGSDLFNNSHAISPCHNLESTAESNLTSTKTQSDISLKYCHQSDMGFHQPTGKIDLDSKLATLRKEMVGLRQLDLSLLNQLWFLHESIQQLKIIPDSRPKCMEVGPNPEWEFGDTSAEDTDDYYGIPIRRPNPYLHPLTETYSHHVSQSSSESSLEYGNI